MVCFPAATHCKCNPVQPSRLTWWLATDLVDVSSLTGAIEPALGVLRSFVIYHCDPDFGELVLLEVLSELDTHAENRLELRIPAGGLAKPAHVANRLEQRAPAGGVSVTPTRVGVATGGGRSGAGVDDAVQMLNDAEKLDRRVRMGEQSLLPDTVRAYQRGLRLWEAAEAVRYQYYQSVQPCGRCFLVPRPRVVLSVGWCATVGLVHSTDAAIGPAVLPDLVDARESCHGEE